jgi:hypothetical protein
MARDLRLQSINDKEPLKSLRDLCFKFQSLLSSLKEQGDLSTLVGVKYECVHKKGLEIT